MNTTLKIKVTTTPRKNTPFALFLFEDDDLTGRSLFHFLNDQEKNYIRNIGSSLKIREKEVKVLILPGTGKAVRKMILVGLGKRNGMSARKAGFTMRIAVQVARKEKLERFAFGVSAMKDMRETRDFYETVATNALMANFEFVQYKTPPPEGFTFLNGIEAVASKQDANVAEGLRRGMIIGEEVNECRRLSNTPGGDMTPAMLAAHARRAARGVNGVRVAIFDEKKIKSLKMGGVEAVGKGSDSPPRFIVLEYMKGPKKEKPVVLVGKGVTFDTGGLNLKPGDHIYEMHMDMSGGAAVIHALIAAARLKLKKNIVALVPAVENMPSGSSYRPGDVLRTMSGKTIEVLNTDAEGRVILADALEYAKKYDPALVVDAATLTGAAVVALGLRYSGLFTTDKKLEQEFRRLGEETGDAVWPLPLSADYEEEVKGTFGDWANTGRHGQAGATAGAVFLWQFTKDRAGAKQSYPWVHLDIAPRMTAMEGEFLAKGAAGAPVRLLVRLLEQ